MHIDGLSCCLSCDRSTFCVVIVMRVICHLLFGAMIMIMEVLEVVNWWWDDDGLDSIDGYDVDDGDT